MSVLQEQAIQTVRLQEKDEAVEAFQRLNDARTEIKQYLPKGFDPDKELEEARAGRYVPAISPEEFLEKFNCEK